MFIHIVKSGDTLSGISRLYDTDLFFLASDNGLTVNSNLVVGQALVVRIPSVIHDVKRGETLSSIARAYGVSVISLLRNNFYMKGNTSLSVGQRIVISYQDDEKRRDIYTNSYAYPYISDELLRSEMPFYTYFTPFTYGINSYGGLVELDDEKMLKIADDYNSRTLMHLSTLTEDGVFSNERASMIFGNQELKDRLIGEIISNVLEKGFAGVDIDFEFINPKEKYDYIQFLQDVRIELEKINLPLFSALAPKTSDEQPGTLYEGHDYAGIGGAVNYVLLMTYEWGYTYGPPMAVAPIGSVSRVIEYGLTRISSSKIFMGIPTYGYDWTLPYVKGSGIPAPSISPVEAVEIARKNNAEIRYDETAEAPYFLYTDDDGRLHEVWFEDIRSCLKKFELADRFNIFGFGFWNAMRDFPQIYVALNARYNIKNFY